MKNVTYTWRADVDRRFRKDTKVEEKMTITLTSLIVYLIVALVSSVLSENLLGTTYPLGLIGAFIAGLVGAWLMVDVFHVILLPEISWGGVPIATAVAGAFLLALAWSLLIRPRYHYWDRR
jgi:uncharacterized membrane protein YeaQ/YmgE (transglycosylase-associated protein family)